MPAALGDRTAQVVARDRAAPGWHDELSDLLAENNEQVIEEFERTGGDPNQTYLEDELRAQVASGSCRPGLLRISR